MLVVVQGGVSGILHCEQVVGISRGRGPLLAIQPRLRVAVGVGVAEEEANNILGGSFESASARGSLNLA